MARQFQLMEIRVALALMAACCVSTMGARVGATRDERTFYQADVFESKKWSVEAKGSCYTAPSFNPQAFRGNACTAYTLLRTDCGQDGRARGDAQHLIVPKKVLWECTGQSGVTRSCRRRSHENLFLIITANYRRGTLSPRNGSHPKLSPCSG